MRPPLADLRGTFWPDTSEITLLEAAVLSGNDKTRRDTRRLCLDSVLVFGHVAPERPRMEYLSYLRASKVSEPFFQPVVAPVLERLNEWRGRRGREEP